MCFFGLFLGVFWCLEERKNVERNWVESKFQKKKNVFSLSDGCLGLFIAPSAKFKAATLKPPLIKLILTLLDR